jgi:putative membrane protein
MEGQRAISASTMLRSVSLVCLVVLLWSALSPHDYFTWFLEVVPAFVVFAAMWITRTTFPLTPLLYGLVGLHACVLMVGGHYTYAEVPLFDWIAQAMGSARNNYDKVGHFMQGFVPAIAAREILLRRSPLQRGKWLSFIVISICLAVSAFYELIEWWVAVLTGDSAEAFLGTQGYAWDTQSDMLLALVGASSALLVLSRFHDRQLAELAR